MRTIIVILILLVTTALSQEKRAIAFEDFFSMKRLGGFAVSPDGKTAVYDVKTPSISDNSFKTDLYLLDLESGESRVYTSARLSSSGAVWSQDGHSLFFNRGGQIWEIAMSGGEAQPVTDVAIGAGGAVMSPDGKHFLFSSEVYPDCPDLDCNENKMREAANSKVKARVIDGLFFRHWNRWLEGKRSHVFLADMDGVVIRDVTPGDYDSPPLDLGSAHDYTFSPDGQEICFVRNTDAIVAASTNNDLFITGLTDDTITRLTENKGNDNHPVYSPDGKYLAYCSMERAGFEADRYRIMLYNRAKKTRQELTTGFNLSARSLQWHPDGKEIFFLAGDQGFITLFKLGIDASDPQPVLKGHFINGFRFIDKNSLLLSIQSANMPAELFRYDLKKEKLTRLTRLNEEALAQLELPKLEEFWFKGAGEDMVQGFLIKPPFFDPGEKYPAIELIHGGPQGGWGDDFHYRWNYQMFAAPGYVVFMINFHGSSGYGQKFTDAVSKDWGGAPYEDILKGTEYVLSHYSFIDRERVGAAGASYGGFMINWIAGDDNPFKCLVSHDGVYEQVSMYGSTEELWFPEWEFNGLPWQQGSLYQKWNPANRAANFKTPTLVIHGEHDYRVPYTQGLQFFTALQRQGVPSRLLFFPDEDHFVRKPQNARLWWKTVQGWFAKYLGNQ